MSDLVPHKRARQGEGLLRGLREVPDVILVEENQAPIVVFRDGSRGRGTCLGCHDAPCMELTESELNLEGTLGAFPGDPVKDVCPSDAISWNEVGDAPVIDTATCIGCGLCAASCPYGAISLSPEGIAQVESSDPDGITVSDPSVTGGHVKSRRVGMLGSNSTRFSCELPEIVNNLTDIEAARLVRNMLVGCGLRASMRRKGDTNIRMDGVFRLASGQIGVVEIETSSATLDSPRALLEDVAVLHGRFGVQMHEIVPVSILGTLPNSRSEYYQVMDDIEKVLGIRCRTITLGALCLILWHFASLDRIEGDLFSTSQGETDLSLSVMQLTGELAVREPHPGAFAPPK